MGKHTPVSTPKAIWLQWNCGQHDPSYGNPDPGDVTWCKDRIFDDDVRYIIDKRYLKRAKRKQRGSNGLQGNETR